MFQLYLEANRRNLIRGDLALLLSSAPPALLPMKQSNKSTVAFGAKKEYYSRPWCWSMLPWHREALSPPCSCSLILYPAMTVVKVCRRNSGQKAPSKESFWGHPTCSPRVCIEPTSSSAALGKLCRNLLCGHSSLSSPAAGPASSCLHLQGVILTWEILTELKC